MARLLDQQIRMLLLLVVLFAFFAGPQIEGNYLTLSTCNGKEVIWCPSTRVVCLTVTAMSSSIPLGQVNLDIAVNNGSFSGIQTASNDELANSATFNFTLDEDKFSYDSLYIQVKTVLFNYSELYSNEYNISRCKELPKPSIKSVEFSSSIGFLELTVLLQVQEDAAVSRCRRCFNQTFIAYVANSTGAVLITLSNPRLSNDSLVFISNDTDLSNQPGLCVIIAAVSANPETNSSCVALDNPVTNGTTSLPTTIIPDVNTTSSNDLVDATGISVGIAVVIVCICGGVLVLVLGYLWCRNRKRKGSYQPPARDEKPLISIENDRLNEVQPQNRPGCGPTPAAAAQGPQQQIKAYGSTTQEKKPDDVTETYRNPLGEGSTLGAEAEKPNSSMNGADMELKDDAGAGDPKCVKVEVEVHPNDTSNGVQPQGQPGCGPTPAATSQELQQQIEVYGSTTQEKKPEYVAETYRNPLGEGSTLGAGAEEPNSSMNGADMEANDGAGVGDPKCVKAEVEEEVKVEVHPVKVYESATQEKEADHVTEAFRIPLEGEASTLEAGAEEPNGSMNEPDMEAKDDAGAVNPKCVKEEVEEEVEVEVHPVKVKELGVIETSFSEPTKERMLSAVEEPTGSESAAHMAPVSVSEMCEEGSNTLTKEDVVSDEEVKQSPPPAVETEDDIVDECVEEGPENYAKEHTKKIDEGGDDKFKARRVPKTATNRSRSNTENSEEQKPTFASGPDASGGSDDCADGHIHPEENSAPEAETGGTTEIVGIQKCVEK